MRLLSTLCAIVMTLSTIQATSQTNCDNNEVIVTLETGAWANEIDFTLFNSNSDSLLVFSDLGFDLQNNTVYSTILCLDDGCYNVAMYDAFGDGWNGAELTISYGDTMIDLGGLPTGNFGQYAFGINADDCQTTLLGCTDPEALNYQPWATEDDGSCEYGFSCETGVAAQMYVCTFANGEELSISVLDEDGNEVFSVENQTSAIVYYDLCLEEGICYTIEMANSEGNNGWYGGYFWVNVDGTQIVNDQLDPDSSFGLSSMSLDGSCPELGCTDPTALNYDASANEDDGSCEYPEDCEANAVTASNYGGVFPDEIEWYLEDENGNVVLTGPGAFDDNNSSQNYACLEDGCYALTMIDNFGDGWNGAYVSFSIDGVEIAYGTFASGEVGYLTISINSECDEIIGGCTNPDAFNYNPDADFDDGSCEWPYLGCTDPEATNYNEWANTDDGSCEYPIECEEGVLAQIYVCTFSNGQNVALEIVDEDGDIAFEASGLNSGQILYFEACLDPDMCYTVNMTNTGGDTGWYGGYYWVNVDGVQVSLDELDNDLSAETTNFSINGNCPTTGCTDQEALNYNPEANEDDGSCEYAEECDSNLVIATLTTSSWGEEISWELLDANQNVVWSGSGYTSNQVYTDYTCLEDGCYTLVMNDSFGDGWNGGAIEFAVSGNIELSATLQMGSIGAATLGLNSEDCVDIVYGCTNPEAINYNPDAVYDDGSCQYPILGCTDQAALNFNPQATEDDGSCVYPVECEDGLVLAQLYVCTFGNGGEVALELVDENGNVVFEVNNLNNGQIVYYDLCLDPNMCYTVNMTNTAGNGGWSGGYYWINVGGVQISTDSLDDDAVNETVTFSINGTCPDEVVTGCTDPEALNYNPDAVEDDGSCIYPEPCDGNNVLFTMQTGTWGGEITWQILNSDSTVVASGGNYPSNQVIVQDICLEDGCYTMEMFDSFGDGWNQAVIVLVLDGETAISFTLDQGSYGAQEFGVNSDCGETEEILGCTDPEAMNYNFLANTDDGSCYYEEDPCDGALVSVGVVTSNYGYEINWYILNDQGDELYYGNGTEPDSLITQNICLEDGCYSLEINDLFGQGADGGVISLSFEDGTAIYVDLVNLWDTVIPFGINSDCSEVEDIFGCTDPEALNYNWLATIDDGSCVYPGPFLGPSYALSSEDVDIEFNFAPNPVENEMLLTFNKLNPTQRLTVDIYDAVGRLVIAQDFGKTQEFFNTNINLGSLESGAYIIVATNGTSTVTERLIKQ